MKNTSSALYIYAPTAPRPSKDANSMLVIRQAMRNDLDSIRQIVRGMVITSVVVELFFMIACGWISAAGYALAGIIVWGVGLVLGLMLQFFCGALTYSYKKANTHLCKLNQVKEVQ